MHVSDISTPVVGKRGAVALRGMFSVTDIDGNSLHIMVDSKHGQKWTPRHDDLLHHLANTLKVQVKK